MAWSMTLTVRLSRGRSTPELGRTQYCLGAVVLTLKASTTSLPAAARLWMVRAWGGIGSAVSGRGKWSSRSGSSAIAPSILLTVLCEVARAATGGGGCLPAVGRGRVRGGEG